MTMILNLLSNFVGILTKWIQFFPFRLILEQIKDFVETTMVLKKEKTGLGICIVGGSDTHLV